MPVDAMAFERLTQIGHAEHLELVSLDQGQAQSRASVLDSLQVQLKVALPGRAEHAFAALAGAEGEANESGCPWRASQRVDTQGVGQAGAGFHAAQFRSKPTGRVYGKQGHG